MGNILWSLSTTIRNPERIPSFFKTICEMEGEDWNEDNQKKFQILLIKNRFYTPKNSGLNPSQISILENLQKEMTFLEAKDIFKSKNYNDPPMRGRTSFDPLEKIGLVSLIDNRITITEVGKKFKEGKIEFGDVFFNAFLKQQYPCPLIAENSTGYCIKPFIGLLHLIKLVNEKWKAAGNNPVGISKEEFGIFCLNIKRYDEIPNIVDKLISYRNQIRSIVGDKNKRNYSNIYTHKYLNGFNNLDKKLKDYRDNMIRCIRLTKLIYIRGNGFYIDLEPRRLVEIDKLTESDNASALSFTKDEWVNYIGALNSYTLPWETPESLVEIQNMIIKDIRKGESELKLDVKPFNIYSDLFKANENIRKLREYRNLIQSKKIKIVYENISKAKEIADLFDSRTINNCGTNKPSVELERLSTLALNIIDDCVEIKPNYPVGDDNEPIFTAPANIPDIECYYKDFNMICEVTMLSSREQWVNEGQPVMRHLRNFENDSKMDNNYCLFIAPHIHQDTFNTFWFATKYEYDGRKQKILPLTISQFKQLIDKVIELKKAGTKIMHNQFKELIEKCTDVSSLNSFSAWKTHIDSEFNIWLSSL